MEAVVQSRTLRPQNHAVSRLHVSLTKPTHGTPTPVLRCSNAGGARGKRRVCSKAGIAGQGSPPNPTGRSSAMTSRCVCEKCRSLLAMGCRARLHFKNKAEEIVVAGTDFVVTKTCRRCGTVNVLRRP